MEQRYASYMDMTVIPYNIILKLATDTSEKVEMLWKLLKYTDLWALSKPNLTFEEKMDLVWTPEKGYVDSYTRYIQRIFKTISIG